MDDDDDDDDDGASRIAGGRMMTTLARMRGLARARTRARGWEYMQMECVRACAGVRGAGARARRRVSRAMGVWNDHETDQLLLYAGGRRTRSRMT